jgi:hypothetical protein
MRRGLNSGRDEAKRVADKYRGHVSTFAELNDSPAQVAGLQGRDLESISVSGLSIEQRSRE